MEGLIVSLIALIFGAIIAIGGTILWIWMLIDCATKEPSEGNDKIIWILIILLTHWIGALIYLIVRRPVRKATLGQ
jgi:nitrate reductase gamma subunit